MVVHESISAFMIDNFYTYIVRVLNTTFKTFSIKTFYYHGHIGRTLSQYENMCM